MPMPEGALIEIIERTDTPDPGVIIPNEIRINGTSILAPADDPVIVHEVTVGASDVVKVTLTLFARRVTMSSEPKEPRVLRPGPDVTQEQVCDALRHAGHAGGDE